MDNFMATTEDNPASDTPHMITPTHGSTTRLCQFRLLFLASISAATGCTAMSDTHMSNDDSFHTQQSTTEANIQIGHWISSGMTVADAMKALESRGFACKPAERSSEDIQSSILCLYSTPPSPAPNQRITAPATPVNWFVTLDSEDGAMITSFQVARSPREIGG